MSSSGSGWVGRPVLRREDGRFLRGEAVYLDDLELPDLLDVAFVRSPYAHARLGVVDPSDAVAQPGVVAVLTAGDLDAERFPGEH